MTAQPLLSVAIVNYNGGPLLRECLSRLVAAVPPETEIFVVDNASRDGSARATDEFPGTRLIRNARNVGYGAANNQALRVARGQFLLFLNPDALVAPDAISTGLAYLRANPDVGILGARILLPDGRLDPPARRSFKTPATYFYKSMGLSRAFPRHRRYGRYYLSYLDEHELADVDSVVGAFMLMPHRVIEQIGGFDERFFLYCEDEDLCWRARQADWRVVYHPGIVVEHHKGSSTGQRPLWTVWQFHRSLVLYHRKNIAPRYPAPVNTAVYAGIAAGLTAGIARVFVTRAGQSRRAELPKMTTANPSAPTDMMPVRSRRSPAERAAKRLLDVVVAATMLVVLSPLLAAVALAVKLGDGGPVLYRWRVVGRAGQPFTGYKFRSMVANADELKAALEGANEMSGPVFKLRGDPRITRVGRILRRYSLDELPQLWSVLIGDMSLVGPRPPLQSEFARFSERQRTKLAVKPGITCLWQVAGRNQITDFEDWLRLDLEYIERWSLGLDLQILVRTVPAVLSGRGAS
jgi:lipopolysaccharide/colanic/teichoic acid biosynthesis glycosyltransferase/GT2 family glycosyltransferase